jgi:hypothetical protein
VPEAVDGGGLIVPPSDPEVRSAPPEMPDALSVRSGWLARRRRIEGRSGIVVKRVADALPDIQAERFLAREHSGGYREHVCAEGSI